MTLTLLIESLETFHVQADIAFPTLFLHFHAAHCTTSLRVYRLNVVIASHAYFHWCTLIQRLRAPHWSPDSRAVKCILLVIHIAYTASELQLIHWLMIHGLRKSIGQPCVLHGDIQ